MRRFEAFARESVHPLMHGWVPENVLTSEVSHSVQDNLALLNDAAFSRGFHAAMPIVGATAEDYRLRILEPNDHGGVLVGIRFRPDPNFAFVQVYSRDFPIDSSEELSALLDVIRQEFRPLHPTYLRVDVARDSTEDRIVTEFGGRTDFFTVAGLVNQLQRQSLPIQMERVHLKRSDSVEFYERYLEEYEDFHSANSHLRALVPVASRDALDTCLSEGLLFEVLVDGNWGGVIAGRKQSAFGMRGFRIVEELLSTSYRSQGLGPALQRHFIDRLPAESHAIVHGAIDPLNFPSLKTAKKTGRRVVMSTQFVDL